MHPVGLVQIPVANSRTIIFIALAVVARRDAWAYHLEDSLRGATAGNPVGGSLGPDGWTVTATTDRLWYALPRLTQGSVEFTITNLTQDRLGSTADNEMFAMYEAGYGITEPIPYSPQFRDNDYKCMLRIYNNAEPNRGGQQKLLWLMCPGGAPGYGACSCSDSFATEPFGGDGTWDGTPQRIRFEWGAGVTRYLRNGAVVLTIDWSGSGLTFGPSELHMSLGTSRPSVVTTAQLPVGIVFSDLVVDGVEGPLATCPAVAVPDAAQSIDAASADAAQMPDASRSAPGDASGGGFASTSVGSGCACSVGSQRHGSSALLSVLAIYFSRRFRRRRQ